MSRLNHENQRRVRLTIKGRVQGVGFRPAVYRLAVRLGLSGFTRNTSSGVAIEIQGPRTKVNEFIASLNANAPRQALIDSVVTVRVPVRIGDRIFRVASSRRSGDIVAGMPPDLAICDACRREMFDRCDRRYLYPFINCTDCGPRFTIIRALPYDRALTSMERFRMCPECQAEFDSPSNRRFEAQPNACSVCGPRVRLVGGRPGSPAADPFAEAAAMLKSGAILAVKGVGGFHLCCRATDTAAVSRLRARKLRPHKPLAVMFSSMTEIRRHCLVDQAEEEELTSPAAPVIVLRRRPGSVISKSISPDTDDIGAFLPYSPLHAVLLSRVSPLVMTSGNRLDEPMAIDGRGLKAILGPIADAALTHNRDILRRCDDSVIKISGKTRVPIRRSRGYVPAPLRIPVSGQPVLACGAELKNTVCLTRGDLAFVSPHIGDLEDPRNYDYFLASVRDFMELMDVRPRIVACDLHPDYASTRYAMSVPNVRREMVQHHHAHIAACLAENNLRERAIGVALDGTGYGADGHIWGGEIMAVDFEKFERLAHFKEYPMPGGKEAILKPDRMALGILFSECGREALALARRHLPGLTAHEAEALVGMLERGCRCPMTSSAGRSFDAAAALLGLGDDVSYEGRAAVRLQAAADKAERRHYPFEIVEENGMPVISLGRAFKALACRPSCGRNTAAAMFHNTIVVALAEICGMIRAKSGMDLVALSGGVFQNDLLLVKLRAMLERQKFRVCVHRHVPPNDGGVALGQAVVALARNNRL